MRSQIDVNVVEQLRNVYIFNEVSEGPDENNNVAPSPGPLDVGVDPLHLGVPLATTLSTAQERVYAIKNTKDPKQLVAWLYLAILSRFPAEDELKAVEKYAQSGVVKPRDAVIDLAWALINSTEFQYRH